MSVDPKTNDPWTTYQVYTTLQKPQGHRQRTHPNLAVARLALLWNGMVVLANYIT